MNHHSQTPISSTLSDQGILHILLNRPNSLNALNLETLNQLEHLLLSAQKNKSIRGLLISGSGNIFCAGADIQELSPLNQETGTSFAEQGQRTLNVLSQLKIPSLAMIHGGAYGGGLELALACTFRMSSPEATFGLPEIKLGILPGFGGTVRATELLGKTRARYLCLTGNSISAETALSWNLIQSIHPKENLLENGFSLLHHISQFSSESIEHILHLTEPSHLSTEEKFKQEAQCFGLACKNPNKNIGVNAFLKKNKPQFI